MIQKKFRLVEKHREYRKKIVANRLSLKEKISGRYQEWRLSRSNAQIVSHIARRLFQKIKNKLRLSYSVHNNIHLSPPKKVKQNIFSIRITGGIGDAVIIARMARDLIANIGEYQFDIYFQSPAVIRPFFSKIKGFRECIHIDAFDQTKHYYQFSLIANQFVYFEDGAINLQEITAKHPKLLGIFSNTVAAKNKYDRYIRLHPTLDGAFSDIATKQGHRRYTYLHHTLGIKYTSDRLDIELASELPSILLDKKYITIHDGWDGNFPIKSHRPTKSIPIEKWAEIVSLIKKERSDITIVQLGGATGSNIDGVDINFKNKLNFDQATTVLSKSLLHIDAESGLVHIAASLGVRSVVLFGPTNSDWFSYPSNINILPKECGNCWWSTNNWMEKCPAGFDIPICTNSISAKLVAKEAIKLLNAV